MSDTAEGELSEMQAIAVAATAEFHRTHGEHTGVVPKGQLHPYEYAALLIEVLRPYREGRLRYRKSDPGEANRAVMDTGNLS